MSDRVRITALSLMLMTAAVHAQDEGSDTNASASASANDAASSIEENSLDNRDLDKLAGREDTETIFLQAQVVNQSALLQQNTLINSQSGHNTLAEGALNGATGFTTVIQNSGNQVVLQNTTLISVTITP